MTGRTGYGVVAALVLAAVSGCTVNGPEAQPPGPSESRTSRPSDLSLEGKQDTDLCALLTPEQQGQLGLRDPAPVSKDDPTDFPGCVWLEAQASGSSPVTISLRAIPMGIEGVVAEAADQSSDTAASYTVAGGYPAKQGQIPGAENLGCTVHVSVASVWTLDVGLSTPPEGMSNQRMCDEAKQAAEAAVTTLAGQG